MQATRQKSSAARLVASASPRDRAEAARSHLIDLGWDEERIVGPAHVDDLYLLRVVPAGEPRLSIVLGSGEALTRPASLAYSSESELIVNWGASQISLGRPTHWQTLPGDSPGLVGDAADRWALEDIFALVGPEKLLGGEARQVSLAGKAHDSLAIQLGNALAGLRRAAAETGLEVDGDLDRAVLRFFHQLLFIRVQEDRGEGQGVEIANVYEQPDETLAGSLHDVIHTYRQTLNSTLFVPSQLSLEQVGTPLLRPLLRSLVVPWQKLKLDFSLSRADLAGRLYQQYLKKTPAVEMAGEGRRPRLVSVAVQRDEQEQTAAFYTPMSVASLLAADTLGTWLRDHRPNKAEQVRLVDPACGSGSFLVAGFHLVRSALESEGRTLRPAAREAILRESIFGADIDAKAIEITQLQLLEAAELSKTCLPDFAENLFVGDSLHPPLDVEAEMEPGVVPWRKIMDRIGGFDAILMNPPFGAQLRLPDRLASEQRAALRERFPEVSGWGSDLAYYFVSLAFALKKTDGCAGMIVPRKLLDGKGAAPTREFLKSIAAPDRIVDFRGLSLFPGANPYVALLEFLPGRRRVEAVDVADSTVDAALALNTILEDRNHIVRHSHAPRTALGSIWTPFALRWRGGLCEQIGREWCPLSEVNEIALHQGTQTGAQKAFTISEDRWRWTADDRVEVEGQSLDPRYVPLVAWGPDIDPLIAPTRRERLLMPFEDDKSKAVDPSVQALLAQRGGFKGRAQPGAVADLRAPKAILRGFSREPAAFADPKGEWITVKGTGGGLVLVPRDGNAEFVNAIAGLLCSSLYQWLLRGFGQPRHDETIEILQMNAEELPWPNLAEAEWKRLAKCAEMTAAAAAKEFGPARTIAYRSARENLDQLVFDLLDVTPKLRQTVEAELVRYL
jgi:N-6 DNA Methylase